MCGHKVFVGFARKDGEEVEDVEKEVLVCVCHRVDEPLVCRDDRLLVVRLSCCPKIQPIRIKKKRGITNTYQLLLGTNVHRNGIESKRMNTGSRKNVGAYRKIEVIWYHGLLCDKRTSDRARS